VNSGVSKWRASLEEAEHLEHMASDAYPVIDAVPPDDFVKLLASTEVALGGALLLPVVPSFAAGAGLTAFAGGLLGMYWRTPHLHEESSPRPTPQGIPFAKDVWLLAIGVALMVGSVTFRRHA